MSGWTLVVPIKPPWTRKTRLIPGLDQQERIALTELMLKRVLTAAKRSKSIDRVGILVRSPENWDGLWFEDHGRGLNAELQGVAASVPYKLAVLHADLPALTSDDVNALIDAARDGAAIAPDRHRQGTNGLAVQDMSKLDFSFGPGSFARHLEMLPDIRAVFREGLSFDVDVPDDLCLAADLGYLTFRDYRERDGAAHECGKYL